MVIFKKKIIGKTLFFSTTPSKQKKKQPPPQFKINEDKNVRKTIKQINKQINIFT